MAASRPDTVADKIEDLRGEMPRKEQMALIENNSSIQQTIMADAIDESAASGGDMVEQWWLPSLGYIVIDIGVAADE